MESRREAYQLARTFIDELRSAGETVAIAESCTGGLIAHLLTTAPGASDVFLLSAVTYSNEAKVTVLGVEAQAIERFGVVSGQVAGQMAAGARSAARSTYGLAATGIAGPGGGTPDKPVGTVWFGFCTDDIAFEERLQLDGKREDIQLKSAVHALSMIRRYREREKWGG